MLTELTWKEVLSSEYKTWGLIYEFAKFAYRTGYPYFEWNGRIYKVISAETYRDTGLTVDDLE